MGGSANAERLRQTTIVTAIANSLRETRMYKTPILERYGTLRQLTVGPIGMFLLGNPLSGSWDSDDDDDGDDDCDDDSHCWSG
jgi:hypothetical protein